MSSGREFRYRNPVTLTPEQRARVDEMFETGIRGRPGYQLGGRFSRQSTRRGSLWPLQHATHDRTGETGRDLNRSQIELLLSAEHACGPILIQRVYGDRRLLVRTGHARHIGWLFRN